MMMKKYIFGYDWLMYKNKGRKIQQSPVSTEEEQMRVTANQSFVCWGTTSKQISNHSDSVGVESTAWNQVWEKSAQFVT